MTTDVENISKLDNYPPDDSGMTPSILKGLFDKGNVDIKSFINDVLIPEFESGYIESITKSGTSAPGTTDTYTITYQSGDTFPITVYNGDNGAKGDTGATGATGAKGDKGDKGDTGTAATIEVGTVSSGTSPSITNVGTSSAAVFNFVLQKGDKGDKGDQGDPGIGDMSKSKYDPNNKDADAFNVDNHVSGTTNKVFSASDKTKLDGIQSGAEVNVNADWNASSGDAQILNKPTEFTPTSHTHGNVTNDGKIGTTADLLIFTGSGGALISKTIADAKTLLGITGGTQIATGSYSGTGTFGSGNKNTITCSFVPKAIIIKHYADPGTFGILIYNSTDAVVALSGTYYANVVSWSGGTSVTWYNTASSARQLNDSSATYYYFAIG